MNFLSVDIACSSLAAAATRLFEQGSYTDVWLIYELLQQWEPQFENKIQSIRKALNSHQLEEIDRLASRPKNLATELQKRLRIAHAISVFGDKGLVDNAFFKIAAEKIPAEIFLARANAIAAAAKQGWRKEWLACVNKYLETFDLAPLRLREEHLKTNTLLYSNLEASSLQPVDGPLVSIYMGCFNSAATVELAIRSLQTQSYQNFELLIFDDCSSDETANIVRRMALHDSRIKFTQNNYNQGTYPSRNQALQQARGEFFTVHDSDDFALPHRLALAVQHLQDNPDHIGVVEHWLRLDEKSRFVFRSGWGGVYSHIAVATLTIRRAHALNSVGYWDSVRFGADTEYFERLKIVHGEKNVPVISVPAALALSHPASLTNHPVHGLTALGTWTPVRSEYARAWKKWHASVNMNSSEKKSLYMPFPLAKRLFDVPDALLSAPVMPITSATNTGKTDHPEKSMTPMANGNAFWKKGSLDDALREYKRVLQNSPLFPQACFNIKIIERSLRHGQSISFEKMPVNTRTRPPSLSTRDSLPERPSLSIVMPVYNVAPYLDTAIVSVLNQHCVDFELIIVNDASTDASRRIIDMHASQDARIRAVHLENNTLGGAGIPSNIGMRMAQGEYIGFVDSDDWVAGNAFAHMLALAREHDADVVIGDFCTFSEDDRTVSSAYDKTAYDGPLNRLVNISATPRLLRLSPVPWRKIYKHSFIRKHNIFYPEGDYFYEDNPLHWFVLTQAKRVIMTSECVSYHRMGREGQTMSSNAYKLSAITSHINSIWNFVRTSASLLVDSKVVTTELWHFWHKADWALKRQSQKCAGALIKKRLSQLAERIHRLGPPSADLAEELHKKYLMYGKAYSNIDLTIVIPAYNVADLIGETIESVLKIKDIQYNVLIIDDGSTDTTLELLRSYEKKYANVHVFQQGNRGAGRARNALIPLCTGTYTYFLDADDIIDAQSLAHAVKQAIANKEDLLFFKYRISFVDEDKSRGMFDSDTKQWVTLVPEQNAATARRIFSSLINYPWNRIIRTELLHDANIFFGPTIVHNDIPYHWLSILAAKKIGYSNVEVCSHKKFSQRVQITNILGAHRMGIFEALRYTQERMIQYPEFAEIHKNWKEFSINLLNWAKNRIPEEMHEQFEKCRNKFIFNLPDKNNEYRPLELGAPTPARLSKTNSTVIETLEAVENV